MICYWNTLLYLNLQNSKGNKDSGFRQYRVCTKKILHLSQAYVVEKVETLFAGYKVSEINQASLWIVITLTDI